MEVNNISATKDGSPYPIVPSVVEVPKQLAIGNVKKKRRRGKSKRKITKPFAKLPWQDRRKNDKSKRNNRFRKIVLAKTHAPFNNNQFLMEIHKPESDNNFNRVTPARTRDSSFSVDSDENYFFSLPEDEEEYLTKEFSSVYEDAQSERLSNMTKDDLIQEYLLLEAKYDNLVKRNERTRVKVDDEKDMVVTDKDTSVTDKDSMVTDRDTSGTSVESSVGDDQSIDYILQRMKEQEEQIHELQIANETLRLENEHLRQMNRESSSEDSESDSSSTSVSESSSNRSISPVVEQTTEDNIPIENHLNANECNGDMDDLGHTHPLENGSHNSNDSSNSLINNVDDL